MTVTSTNKYVRINDTIYPLSSIKIIIDENKKTIGLRTIQGDYIEENANYEDISVNGTLSASLADAINGLTTAIYQ